MKRYPNLLDFEAACPYLFLCTNHSSGRRSPWHAAANHLGLSCTERETLERWQRSTTMAAGLARQGRIVLLLVAGHSQTDVAQMVGVQRQARQSPGACPIPGHARAAWRVSP